MSGQNLNVFAEQELVDLLADEPEFLALADAIARTGAGMARRHRHALALRLLVAAALLTVVAAAALVAPWRGSEHVALVDRALAAVGDGPVIHAVIEDTTGSTYVDLATGQSTPQLRTFEIWFDGQRHVRHTLASIDGTRVDDMLETPTGGVTSSGPIYTCTWIKAHPARAKQDGVGCDAGASRQAQPPSLDPALAGFVDGYRKALQDGSAKVVGTGEALGKTVTWLELATDDGGSERVAIDLQSGKPTVVLTFRNGIRGWTYQVLSLEALPAGSGNFTSPQPPSEPSPSGGSVRDAAPIDVGAASAVVPGAVFAGTDVNGLPLNKVLRSTLVTGYDSTAPPTRTAGVEFFYGGDGSAQGGSYVRLLEAATPEMAYAWVMPMTAPKPGQILVTGGLFGGHLLVNGVYVTIQASDHDLLLSAARALRSVEPN